MDEEAQERLRQWLSGSGAQDLRKFYEYRLREVQQAMYLAALQSSDAAVSVPAAQLGQIRQTLNILNGDVGLVLDKEQQYEKK